jgi:hypothetical protein
VKKVFIIGFNRTATKAFSEMFKKGGYVSFHYACHDRNGNVAVLAQKMKANLESYYNLLHDIDHANVYSDMFWHRENEWIDGIKLYDKFNQEYPDSYFILNTREMNGWLESKKNHKKGAYLKRSMEYHNLDEQGMLDWFKRDREKTEDDIRTYFQNYSKFIEFDVENDPIVNLIDFLKPDFFLKEKHWVRV